MSAVAAIHHSGVFVPWSIDEGRPLATGSGPDDVVAELTRRGASEDEARAMVDRARAHGSSITSPDGRPMSASEAIEDNAAGAFGEEVPVEEIFAHLLLHRRPL
jgi:hypothetical protein